MKYLHSDNSCVQCRVLDICGCRKCLNDDEDDDDDIENDIENDVAINTYVTVPSAPLQPPPYTYKGLESANNYP